MDLVIRATVMFAILYVLVRVVGRRELSEMTPFDLVLLIVLGDLVQQGTTQEDMSLTGATLAAGTMVFWVVVLSYVTYRWRPARKAIRGQPVLVVRDGEVLDESLRLQRIDREYLCEAARQQGIGDLADVRFGVLESDGMFSFIRAEDGEGEDESADDSAGTQAEHHKP